jgi:hypothetical protein
VIRHGLALAFDTDAIPALRGRQFDCLDIAIDNFIGNTISTAER